MKTSYKLNQTLSQKLKLSKTMQAQINMLGMNQAKISSLLTEIANTNPFLEYVPSSDINKYLEEAVSSKPKLQDELYYQLHTTTINYNEKICEFIINSLDSHGFFTLNHEKAIRHLHTNKKQFDFNLKLIQSFEPIGVAASSSIDSICIQLEHKKYLNAAYMLKTFPNEVENQQWQLISKKMKTSIDVVYDYLYQIQTCTPFPCSQYSTSNTEYIIPDLEIQVIDDDIIIQPKEIGKIELISQENINKELKEYFNQAKFYIDSLNKRNKTLLVLSNTLFTIQKSHFLYNDELHACGIKDISEATGFSYSTVSRTLSNKYYLYDGLIYPIKDLFVSSTKQGSSKDAIKSAIKYYIDNEDSTCPYNDDQLVSLLSDLELFVSRRTISKYRSQMNIPNSKQRKINFKSKASSEKKL